MHKDLGMTSRRTMHNEGVSAGLHNIHDHIFRLRKLLKETFNQRLKGVGCVEAVSITRGEIVPTRACKAKGAAAM